MWRYCKFLLRRGSCPHDATRFLTRSILKKALESVPVNPILHQGIPVIKISSRGQSKKRILTLSNDNLALFCTHQKIHAAKGAVAKVASTLPIPMWTPSRGFAVSSSEESTRDRYVRYIDVADLDYLQTGIVGTFNLETSPKRKVYEKNRKAILTIYHHGQQSLDLLIEDDNLRQDLINVLLKIQTTYLEVERWVSNDALLLRYIWYDVDVDGSGMISSKEFSKICARVNIYLKDSDRIFSKFLKDQKIVDRKEISYGECMALLQSIKPQMPGMQLWDTLFGATKKTVTAKALWTKFLKKTQGETDTTLDDAEALLKSLKTLELDEGSDPASASSLSKPKFVAFLHSEFNDAYDPITQELAGPLNKPMSHYWINTSHNTYLTGDQIQSKSSVEAYAKSLLRGCKCLELDCWDGEKKGKDFIPVVFHGHTLTSKIEFRNIILVVKNYVEGHPDTYPIILSLENHCSQPFQQAMANAMKEIIGEKLYIPTKKQASGDLPSPESLRGMVVIKGKRPPEPDEGEEETKESPEDEVDPYEEPIQAGKDKNAKPPKIVPELAAMTLFHGTKWKDFDKSIEQPQSSMHSIGETKITKIIAKSPKNATLWRKYNSQHMTRTYPAGTRLNSSNYNPTLAWAMGSQLVALNFQTHDTPLLLNDGRFRQNGNCGYVLKPKAIMGGPKEPSKTVKIKILSGHCLPKPAGNKYGETIDPLVKVELHDVKRSEGKEEYINTFHLTSVIDDNGFCPVWNDKGKEFQVENPAVAMFQFSLLDKDLVGDDKVACATIPVSCLRQGWRSVQLYDHRNTRTGAFRFATLLVEIEY